MKIIMPTIDITGDSPERIMARSGELVGFSKTRAVWRFGFLPDSSHAKVYKVSLPMFIWVLSDYSGKQLYVHNGYGIDLPKRFTNVIGWAK